MEQAVLRAPQEQRFQANLNRALAILSDTPAPPARPPEPGPEPAPEPGPQEPESPDAQIPTAPPEIPAAKPVEAATAGSRRFDGRCIPQFQDRSDSRQSSERSGLSLILQSGRRRYSKNRLHQRRR